MSDVIKSLMPNPITPENSNIRKCCPEEEKDKQIEEMEKIIQKRDDEAMYASIAHSLYDAGYRKSTDVAAEIFAEIKRIGGCLDGIRLNHWDIADLEKKYTKEIMEEE